MEEIKIILKKRWTSLSKKEEYKLKKCVKKRQSGVLWA